MAKRRKQYRGTPEQHAVHARGMVGWARRDLQHARRQLAAGSCNAALNSLRMAEYQIGQYAVHVDAGPLPRRTPGAERVLRSAWARFSAKCMKKK